MKLSVLFEFLLIFIIIAFAASKPLVPDAAKALHTSYKPTVLQSNARANSTESGQDDDIFGFGADEDISDDNDDDDIFGLIDDEDYSDKDPISNYSPSSDEEFEFVLFGEDVFASLFEDDRQQKPANVTSIAKPVNDSQSSSALVLATKPTIIEKVTVLPIDKLGMNMHQNPALEITEKNHTENALLNLPPTSESIKNTVALNQMKNEISEPVLTSDSVEEEGLIVVSDDTQKIEQIINARPLSTDKEINTKVILHKNAVSAPPTIRTTSKMPN